MIEKQIDKLKYQYSLPKKFKEAWIKALKSGNYVQGAGSLRKDPTHSTPNCKPTYCCLGVACSIAGVPEEYITDEWIDDFPEDVSEYDVVPEALHGTSDENELVHALSTMNDEYDDSQYEKHKFSFTDIADWIDDNIKAI